MMEPAGSISPPSNHRKHAHLLLVDDDPALLKALSGTLQNRLGHFILDTCDTGMKALDCVATRHYDTIISDVNMPGMNGLELLTRVKRVQPHTPIVLISGHADEGLISKAIHAGVDDFIVKPIDRDRFIRTIRHTLHLSRLRLLVERRQDNIRRAQACHVALVDKLNESNERWLSILKQKPGSQGTVNVLTDAGMRLDRVQQEVDRFKARSFRHLAILDAFLLDATRAHRHLSEELHMVEEALRRLTLSRLHGR